MCTAETGLFCLSVFSECRTSGATACANTDGSAANTAPCACGAMDCSAGTGLFCHADLDVCSSTGGRLAKVYAKVTTGNCADAGYDYIMEEDECMAGAAAVGVTVDMPDDIEVMPGNGPPGCWSEHGMRLMINTDTSGSWSEPCDDYVPCVCARLVAVCAETDGTAPNAAGDCACGSDAAPCTAATGRYCNSAGGGRCSVAITSPTPSPTTDAASCENPGAPYFCPGTSSCVAHCSHSCESFVFTPVVGAASTSCLAPTAALCESAGKRFCAGPLVCVEDCQECGQTNPDAGDNTCVVPTEAACRDQGQKWCAPTQSCVN